MILTEENLSLFNIKVATLHPSRNASEILNPAKNKRINPYARYSPLNSYDENGNFTKSCLAFLTSSSVPYQTPMNVFRNSDYIPSINSFLNYTDEEIFPFEFDFPNSMDFTKDYIFRVNTVEQSQYTLTFDEFFYPNNKIYICFYLIKQVNPEYSRVEKYAWKTIQPNVDNIVNLSTLFTQEQLANTDYTVHFLVGVTNREQDQFINTTPGVGNFWSILFKQGYGISDQCWYKSNYRKYKIAYR